MSAPLGTIERLLAKEGTEFIRGLLQSYIDARCAAEQPIEVVDADGVARPHVCTSTRRVETSFGEFMAFVGRPNRGSTDRNHSCSQVPHKSRTQRFSQVAQPPRREPLLHRRGEHDDHAEIDPSSEVARRRRRGACGGIDRAREVNRLS